MESIVQDDAFYRELTVSGDLRFSTRLYDVADSSKRILEVPGILGLSDRRDQVVSTLSDSLRRRTAIARTFLRTLRCPSSTNRRSA
jgi:ABC-type multidrug transport system ATPase subunit